MLKPSSEVDSPNKNTTEYAEIVYVSKNDEQKEQTTEPTGQAKPEK